MPTAEFKDLFSGHAQDYARFRPTYPPELFANIASLVTERETAWDCATGNGQAAIALAPYFQTIYATDASQKQLDQATPNPHVRYSLGTAEASGLESQSVTLVTVAQAFHWFKHQAFYEEVRRVAKTGKSVLAIWMYNLARIDPGLDAVVDHYYIQTVGKYWEPERRLVDAEYRTIAVPFPELKVPEVRLSVHWTLAQFIGYVGTWSATQTAAKTLGTNPLIELTPLLSRAWGANPEAPKQITWSVAQRFFSV